MKLICRSLLGVGIAGMLFGTVSSCTNARPRPNNGLLEIRVDGGYGFLKCLSLKADGGFTWSGWEPPRKAASVREGKLAVDDVQRIWDMAKKVEESAEKGEYQGGAHTCTIELVFPDKTRIIRVKSAEQDQRPTLLKDFMDTLWKTRDRR
ncbi:MAG: hypothetical protein WBD75_02675 [Phycisphaerae bacterium]